ncbi:SDR family oxidoreductase [Mycolicibacter arupensis]|jgi:NAD(P)-dependent dehydrogenase (short-subunit alcohol dehydrogenase family)|uniref:Short-chain dehydrogenase n=3 Tax=Mycolicibacter arupensis TaxID=342002 RepID=A0A0F5MSR0_9MYCO|nr:SDR family oxidoreductase [Mycolicibacter arupensis]KKB97843.1 short-chain dehydrogenase [Mycolicibacter arupensis]MCV7277584.1 SDR family oxidoreductase [Mycolicibacter arupensis]ORA00057.1 short-chain dehydrogenase [Mycolicibacter arupensis]
MSSIHSQVVFITGGAHGIGEQLARRLHSQGARVVVTDLDEAALTKLGDELGERALTAVADVRDLAALQAVAAQAAERFGGIDTVVANAGIASYGSVLNVDPETFKRVIDVDVIGVFNTVRAALPSVIERRGYVLVVSSLAAFSPLAGMASYDAAKAGVEHFASALRQEVAYQGVEVGSAHMGWIDTPLVRDTKADLGAFDDMMATLPWPLNKTTSVDKCVDAFVKGIEGRSRRVYCPRWVGAFRWLKPVLTLRPVERTLIKGAATIVPRMDAEVAALGRSTSAYNEKMEK